MESRGITMKKTVYIVCMALILVMISGCGKGKIKNPSEVVESYISKWSENDFNGMYDMLTKSTKETVDKEYFTERYEKVYKDLEIKDLKITPSSSWTEEDDKQAIDDETATLPLQISMNSLAGPIEFEYDLHMQLVELNNKEKEIKWKIEWDEGLILPGLENDGKVLVERESPRRGEIIDRNQMPLAINASAYEVGIVPGWMENEAEEISELARILNLSEADIKDSIHASWVQPEYFVPLKTVPQTSEDILNEVTQIPGVSTKESTGRSYPLGEAAAHLTGFIGPITKEEMDKHPEGTYHDGDLIGKRGLEQLYEEQLRGEEGVKIIVETVENEETQKEIIAEKPVENGKTIQLSIDVNTQEKIFNSYEENAGTAAAINPKTGEIYALVSSPSFDPNDFIYGITQTKWDALSSDPNQPLFNRFTATFAPGSVLKPITAAVGLKNGTITHDKGIDINGLTWSKKGWGEVEVTRVSTTSVPVDLKLALTKSDNIYFAMKAVEMGSDAFIKGMKAFGFEEKLPLEYPITASQISNDGTLGEILLAHTSYGQGQIEVSALHLALAYTPFLNDGNMMKPSLLKEESKGEIWKKDLISKEDATRLKEDLRAVVESGTGGSAKDADLAISGKTGTAELKKSKDSQGHQNGWFVGYPTEDEDIIIAMMVEKSEDIGTSAYAAGKVKDLLKDIKK